MLTSETLLILQASKGVAEHTSLCAQLQIEHLSQDLLILKELFENLMRIGCEAVSGSQLALLIESFLELLNAELVEIGSFDGIAKHFVCFC